MKANALLQGIYVLGLTNYRDEASKWATVALKCHSEFGGAHSHAVSGISQLDIMLRELEREQAEAVPGADDAFLSHGLITTLSDAWLLASYEVVRAAKAQKGAAGTTNRMKFLHEQLALARMPIAKAEISGADRHRQKSGGLPALMMHPVGEGDDNSAKPYAHDGSYVVPKAMCSQTGTIIWYPFDLSTQRTIAVSRLDLSNQFLALFD